jgi:hypothetical protein
MDTMTQGIKENRIPVAGELCYNSAKIPQQKGGNNEQSESYLLPV